MNYISGTQNDTASFKNAVRRLNSGVIQYDKEAVKESKKVFGSWVNDTTLGSLAHYYLAYCNYRLNTSFVEDRDNVDEELTDEALTHLETAKKHESLKAEVLALKSSFYGMKISGPISAMNYGPKANKAIEKALELAPENPRVRLLDAIGSYYKPSFAGGGISNSIKGLKEAIELFKDSGKENTSEQSVNDFISWGEAESYAWLGKIYIEEEEWGKAHQMLSKALDINKDYHWVHDELKPLLPDSLEFNENY